LYCFSGQPIAPKDPPVSPTALLTRPTDSPLPAAAGLAHRTYSPKRGSGVTVHDMFCGAGGMSAGAVLAGATIVLGANHSAISCASFQKNHPDAKVDCADICSTDPRRYPPADLLLAGPECTHHSYARGRAKNDESLFDPKGDLVAERSRATMWDVVRFTEYHRYKAVIVENVEAVSKWGAEKGTKLAHDAFGPLFIAWLMAMTGLGYDYKIVHLNSMTVGVPQSRDRHFVVFWRKGETAPDLDINPSCFCAQCNKVVAGVQTLRRPGSVRATYGSGYDYTCPNCRHRAAPIVKPAASIIDWSIPGTRIGDRAKPLQPATMARIERCRPKLKRRPDVVTLEQLQAGGEVNDPDGLVVTVGGNSHEREGQTRGWSTDRPLTTITGTADRALVTPPPTEPIEDAFVMSNMNNNVPRPAATEPTATITSGNKLALVYPEQNGVATDRQRAAQSPYAIEPTQVDLRANNRPRPAATEPLSTIAAAGRHHGLTYVLANYNPGWMRHADTDVVGTVTARDSHSLVSLDGLAPTHVPAAAPRADVDPATVPIEDFYFRMFETHELALGQGFDPSYVLVGNKRDRQSQIGNAVSPPASFELVSRLIDWAGSVG
jgi:DNA (cytosine-5)-methyltransferase 1